MLESFLCQEKKNVEQVTESNFQTFSFDDFKIGVELSFIFVMRVLMLKISV